jgi:hypothetical protein
VLPALAGVDALIDAVAPGGGVAVVGFAGADPEDLGVRRRDLDITERDRALALEDRREGRPPLTVFQSPPEAVAT